MHGPLKLLKLDETRVYLKASILLSPPKTPKVLKELVSYSIIRYITILKSHISSTYTRSPQ
jgi:hypothetical protein